jgi:hypothetical protein
LRCGAGQPDWDLLEVIVRPDGLAVFRAQSEKYLPNPPGCFWRNCISGPRARAHLQQLQADLGWPSLETDEDKRWVPLLLH